MELRLDGLLGYEDEADDAAKGRSVEQGDAARRKEERELKDGEADDDAGDDGRENAVDEDELEAEERDDLDGDESSLDTDEADTMRDGLSAAWIVPGQRAELRA